ncbi:MAG: hypothetical protein IIX52_00475 [Paludibacteraceae bacterium]|nr:hypothetical protein [Paludibacteraceae bacterium]
MDNVTIIKELLTEVEGLQRQLDVMGQKLEVMKQRLALAEISMQADAAALQASELRVKQLEIIVASQKSQVDESPNRETDESLNRGIVESPNCGTDESLNRGIVESPNCGTDESLNCETDESPNCLNDSIKKSVAELVEAPESDLPISRFTDSSSKNTDSSTPSRDARIITDLKKAIGLNDRFRFRNDLFNKDEKLMLDTIEALNGLANMSDAKAYLSARFTWKEDDASVVYFYEILERKFV